MSSAAPPPLPFNVTAELKALKHEKQNHDLRRLPPNATIQRRPLNHAPITDLRSSGVKNPKVVYVSRRTPAIAAIKRVKKYLSTTEQRALQNAGASFGRKARRGGPREAVEQANEALSNNKEEVLVKASGRAMEQALRVAEWFRNKDTDMLCNVEVRTGSVRAIDDIVEKAAADDKENEDGMDVETEEQGEDGSSKLQVGNTTLELLGGADLTTIDSAGQSKSTADKRPDSTAGKTDDNTSAQDHSLVRGSRRARKKKHREMYDACDLPEARLRWVKTVEVAISLKG